MIQTKDIKYNYPGQAGISFPDISLGARDSCLIIGNSGTGKTTLLHLLGGLMPSKQGEIEIKGQDISALKGKQLDKFRGMNIGIVFQKHHFLDSINVQENIFLAAGMVNKSVDTDWFDKLTQSLRIENLLHKKAKQLSEGEKQRVAIARALLNKPDLILADEPTSSLDDEHTEEVIQLLKGLSENVNASLIIVTHDQRLKDRFNLKIELS